MAALSPRAMAAAVVGGPTAVGAALADRMFGTTGAWKPTSELDPDATPSKKEGLLHNCVICSRPKGTFQITYCENNGCPGKVFAHAHCMGRSNSLRVGALPCWNGASVKAAPILDSIGSIGQKSAICRLFEFFGRAPPPPSASPPGAGSAGPQSMISEEGLARAIQAVTVAQGQDGGVASSASLPAERAKSIAWASLLRVRPGAKSIDLQPYLGKKESQIPHYPLTMLTGSETNPDALTRPPMAEMAPFLAFELALSARTAARTYSQRGWRGGIGPTGSRRRHVGTQRSSDRGLATACADLDSDGGQAKFAHSSGYFPCSCATNVSV